MDATRLLIRADVRQRWQPLVLLAVTVALVVGAVLAATSGARRTSTVLDRFLAATNSSDTMLGVAWPAIADDDAVVAAMLDELRSLEGVEVARAQSFMPIDAGTEYDFGAVTPYGDERIPTDVPVVVAGRLPDDDDPAEVALNEIAAEELGLGVGDRLEAGTMSDADAAAAFETNFDSGFRLDGPRLELVVVGIVREIDDLSPTGSENPQAHTSLAFAAEFDDASRFTAMFLLQTDARSFDRAEANAVVRRHTPVGAEVFGGLVETEFEAIRTAFDSIAVGLALFAGVGLVAGLIVIGLVVLRHLQLGRSDREGALALGVPRRQLAVAAWIALLTAVVPGVIGGSVLASLASPLFPYSVARRAEVESGLRFDPLVTVGLAAVIALLLAVVAALMTILELRRRTVDRAPVAHLASIRSHLAPPIADGCSTVLWAAGRRSAIQPWTAVAGAVIGIAGIVAIGVFESSRTAAAGDPSRYGRTWDLQPELMTGDPMGVVEGLAADPRVDGVGGVFCGTATIVDDLVQLCTFDVFDGAIVPLTLSGRLPSAPGEIALGRNVEDRLGVGVGDVVSVGGHASGSAALTVVGIVVNPDVGDAAGPGDGAVLSVDGFEDVVGSIWDQPYAELVIDLADELDAESAATALSDDHRIEMSPYAFAEAPHQLTQLGRMRTSLIALAFFLGALGALGLIHYLVISSRQRLSQIAVLRTLGFVRSQVCGSASTQATTIAAAGLVLGIPAGLIVGRWTWLYSVRTIGMDDTPSIPWSILSVVAAAALVGSAVIAVYPGLRATRIRPAAALRAE